MGYSIVQRPCPECGHKQQDMVLKHGDLVASEYIRALCSECRTRYAKPVLDPSGEWNQQPPWRK